MRLTILGGGGFRVPLVYRALAADPARLVDEVVLHDEDPRRLQAIARVLHQLGPGPRVRLAAGLDDAVREADVVFSAVRVGGTAGRVHDEQVALGLGVLGQETTGPGGIAYALRTLPVASRIAERVAELAPSAWVLNFTNPAGMVTAAMQRVLGDRVIGICDSPTGLVHRVAGALHVDPAELVPGYAGLNHLGWLRSAHVGGVDLLPGLLSDDAALGGFEEGRLFGADLLRVLGAVPNEYLYYYYCTREALAAMSSAESTRGQVIAEQQRALYPRLAETAEPLAVWEAARLARERGYLAEARDAQAERDAADLAGGGYEQVALAAMRALVTGEPAELILGVRNACGHGASGHGASGHGASGHDTSGRGASGRGAGGRGASGHDEPLALPQLPQDAVVEVPTRVDATGVQPRPQPPFDEHQLGLVSAVRSAETATLAAARLGVRSGEGRTAALRAFTVHPLVDSAAVARQLLKAYLGPGA